VGAIIDRNLMSICPEITAITDQNTAWHWTLYGGEDFELILCVQPELAQILTHKYPAQFMTIGKITKNSEIDLIDSKNFYPKVLLTQTEIFNHF
jgi:thiamine-monophosphate kinase